MLRKYWIAVLLLLMAVGAKAQSSRHFTFHYDFTVQNVPQGEPLRVWIPQATSDDWQTVKLVSVSGDLPLHRTQEQVRGNHMFFAETKHATTPEYHFHIVYDIERRERRAFVDGKFIGPAEKISASERARDLRPDKLVPITGEPAEIAATETQGKENELDRAWAIYDYVFRTMKYDKSGTGWGRGDALWACDSKRGNCTDFHSLFMAMARSENIPARFAIGFPLPADRQSGEIAGYHCWSEFYLEGNGWVPIDISEAWQQKKEDYFFGSHDANRVQFSVGRDLELSPKQAGEPLNYFVYPYVEVSGKAFTNVNNSFSFADHDEKVAQKK
jgi:transglutaminase superfamily protein